MLNVHGLSNHFLMDYDVHIWNFLFGGLKNVHCFFVIPSNWSWQTNWPDIKHAYAKCKNQSKMPLDLHEHKHFF